MASTPSARSVVLFNPAPRAGFQAHRRVELPLSVLCPATPLDLQGYRVHIVDQFANPNWEANLDKALAERPICLGVTCMTGPQILRAIEVSKHAKQRYPDLPVVWGGIHASLLPHQTLSHPAIDAVVVGEGEATFAELVKALEEGTPLDACRGSSSRNKAASPRRPAAASWISTPSRRSRTTCSTWTCTGAACSAWTTHLQHQPRLHLPLRLLLGPRDAQAPVAGDGAGHGDGADAARDPRPRHPWLPVLRRPLLHRPESAPAGSWKTSSAPIWG